MPARWRSSSAIRRRARRFYFSWPLQTCTYEPAVADWFSGARKAKETASAWDAVIFGGVEGDRTLDLRIANATLSQLSYHPFSAVEIIASGGRQPASGGTDSYTGGRAALTDSRSSPAYDCSRRARRRGKGEQMNGNRALVVLATVAVIFLLYWGEPFFVPLLIALFLSYALAPVVSAITRVVRYRVLASALVVLSIIALGGVAAWAWNEDVETLWQKVPVAAKTISRSLQKMAQSPGSPMAEVKKAAAEVESIGRTSSAPPPPSAAPAQASAPMWQVLWKGWTDVMQAAAEGVVG